MASLANQTISSTYDGLVKTSTDQPVPISGVQLLEDGVGNSLALSVGRANQGVTITGTATATAFAGPLTGNVTGNVTGDLTGNVTGTLSGTVTGDLIGDLTGSVLTAAQTNITSVGTLSSLAVSGNLAVDTNTLFVDAANNRVGIGTQSPEDMLHLVTSTGTAAVKFDGNGVGSARIHSTFGILNLEADDANENAASYISFSNHGSERMRIDASGRVGIGTSSPSEKVQIKMSNTGELSFLESGSSSTAIKSSGSLVFETNPLSNFIFRGFDVGAGATERMRIDSSGNVLVGKSSTGIANDGVEINSVGQAFFTCTGGAGVQVNRKGSDGNAITMFNDGTEITSFAMAGSDLQVKMGGSERMRIDSSGSVSIANGEQATNAISAQLVLGNRGTLSSTSAGAAKIVALTGSPNWYSGTSLAFYTNGGPDVTSTEPTERMRIDSSGNITQTASDASFIVSCNNAGGVATLSLKGLGTNGSSVADTRIEAIPEGSAAAASMAFVTREGSGARTEKMRITSSGNVGIGASPTQRLSVVSDGGVTRANIINTANAAAGSGIQFVVQSGGSQVSNATLRVDNVGNFSVFNGTTSETERLVITSSGEFRSRPIYDQTTAVAANVNVDGGTGAVRRSTSSLKYKTDVRDYDKGLDVIKTLRPVYYKGKTDGDKQFAGLIAEEVHDSGLEEFVQYAEDGSPDALAYTHMVALLVNGIKELKAEIETLKTQING